MKIAIDRMKFQTALNIVKDVAGGGQDLMILQNVKVETTGDDEITMTATNLDQTISTKAKCQVSEPGATTLPARMLASMVGALTSPVVEIKHDGSAAKAILSGGDVTYKIATINPKEYPQQATVGGTDVTFTQGEFKTLLRKAAYAASVDTTRRVLTGVCIQTEKGNVNAIATDGRRLALGSVAKENAEDGLEVVIPSSTVRLLQKVIGSEGDVTCKFENGKAALFTTDSCTLQTKLIDESYPNWRNVVPRELTHTIPVDRELFANAVRQVSLSADTSTPSIIITLKNGVMTLTSSAQDLSDAKAVIPVKFDDGEIKVSLNPKYVLDSLGSFDDDTVNFCITNGTTPLKISAEGSESLAIIMPLRVN